MPFMNKTDKQILALQRAARNPKYRPKVKAKIRQIKSNRAWNNFLAQ